MPFELENVVPWGRSMTEYIAMFNLTQSDLSKKIVGVGDGPASFNSEMTKAGKTVISIDPIYRFSKKELEHRIQETKDIVMEQMNENRENFIWTSIKNPEELERIRLNAMSEFLVDFPLGKKEGRYIYHELPNRTNFEDDQFDLGLSSHFLLLYSGLGLDFHIESITEMLRICREIRLFPILNLDARESEVLDGILSHFEANYTLEVIPVDYEFQKGGNKLVRIGRNKNTLT